MCCERSWSQDRVWCVSLTHTRRWSTCCILIRTRTPEVAQNSVSLPSDGLVSRWRHEVVRSSRLVVRDGVWRATHSRLTWTLHPLMTSEGGRTWERRCVLGWRAWTVTRQWRARKVKVEQWRRKSRNSRSNHRCDQSRLGTSLIASCDRSIGAPSTLRFRHFRFRHAIASTSQTTRLGSLTLNLDLLLQHLLLGRACVDVWVAEGGVRAGRRDRAGGLGWFVEVEPPPTPASWSAAARRSENDALPVVFERCLCKTRQVAKLCGKKGNKSKYDVKILNTSFQTINDLNLTLFGVFPWVWLSQALSWEKWRYDFTAWKRVATELDTCSNFL